MDNVNELFISVFSFIGGAGIISGILLRKFDKMEKKLDRQADARVKESIVIISGLKAIGHLAEATAIAQRDGKTNGEMKKAMEYYTESRDELNDYLLRQSAERNHLRA